MNENLPPTDFDAARKAREERMAQQLEYDTFNAPPMVRRTSNWFAYAFTVSISVLIIAGIWRAIYFMVTGE